MKNIKCPVCSSKVNIKCEDYNSNKVDVDTGEKIVVKAIKLCHCSNEKCKFCWLPHEEEMKIDDAIRKRTR